MVDSDLQSAPTFSPASPLGMLRDRLKDAGMRSAGQLGAGLSEILGSRAAGALGIVTYHRISPVIPGLPKPLHNVTPEVFRQQITGLLCRGFTIWPLSRVLNFHERGLLVPPRTAVITFDDGYGSVYAHAWPILQELCVPATIFVNTAFLDTDYPFSCDDWGMCHEGFAPVDSYRPLNHAECEKMLDSKLIELGAHTHTHQDFRGRPRDFLEDMSVNLEMLRVSFGVEAPSFAFPYGTVHAGFTSPKLVAVARDLGLRCGLSTESVLVDPASDPFTWGRFNAFPWDTGATLSAKLSGWYSWAPALRQAFARRLRSIRPTEVTMQPTNHDLQEALR